MILVNILEKDDVVLATDWCRPLVLQTMSSGSISFKSCYGGTPENNAEWAPANCVFGSVWFKTPITAAKFDGCGIRYEFVRGSVPKLHRLAMYDYTDLRQFA